MALHRLYGLELSSDRAIPGLPVLPNPGRGHDVRIRLKPEGFPLSKFCLPSEYFYVSRTKDEAGNPTLQAALLVDRGYLTLRYCNGAHFAIDFRGNDVLVDWPDSLTLEDVALYLVGPVFGVVLRLRGMIPLHASAIVIGERAIALAGPPGAGKSTTAAAFAKCGYRVISDDVVALQEERSQFVIPPGYPRVNLWSESAEAIVGKTDTLPRICPTLEKCFMPLDPARQFETSSLRLGAIYVLKEREPGLIAPAVEALTGTEAFIAVLGNTYMNHLPDPEKRCREFELLGRLIAQVPIRQVHAIADLSKLSVLCTAIAADAASLLTNKAVPLGADRDTDKAQHQSKVQAAAQNV